MSRLRKILGTCYGYLAAVFLLAAVGTVPFFFRLLRTRSHRPAYASPEHPALIAAAGALEGFILFAPLLIGTTAGMAWWTIRGGKPTARRWALAASVIAILLGLPLIAPAYFEWKYRHHVGAGPFLLYAPIFALGIAGLIAFWRRDSAPQLESIPVRIAGDGTNSFLDAVSGVLAGAGILGGIYLYEWWGRAHGLYPNYGYLYWFEILIIAFIVTTLHELGHASVGLSLGMKLSAFVLGPFRWRLRDGRWTFEFHLAGLISAEGVTGVVPSRPDQSRLDMIAMISAGPLANLFTGLLVVPFVLTAPRSPWAADWEFLALLATVSLVTFAINLFPLRGERLYSDGARIYQLIKGGPWADLQRARTCVLSTLVTPLRPKDYDIGAIQRAEVAFQQGHEALLLRLFATSYFIDSGKLPEAQEAFAEAERIYAESASDIPAELLTAFVFRAAFLRQDAFAARQWWDRMEAKKPTHFGTDFWLARSALLWVEGMRSEALEAWKEGNTLAQKLPPAGAYEFDRYRAALLRKAMDQAPAKETDERPALTAER